MDTFVDKDGVQDGPFESYHENGEVRDKGTYKDNEKCGEWFEWGETVTYDPC
jgi:antitoxin component YwqK of YwqJK toxin-antitoxin module